MKSVNRLIFSTLIIFGVVGGSTAQAQTTAGYYRTCANYNPDYEEVYENSKKDSLADDAGALSKYLRDSGCRKQIIRAIEVIKEQSKACKISTYPDYDTYQRGLIGHLKRSEFQSNETLMDAPIEMVAPDVLRYILKCF